MATLRPQGKQPGQRDTTKKHKRLGGIRQIRISLQKQPRHLPEEAGVGETGGNCNIFHIFAHYVEHVFY